jgi:pSer/pThr/pTyr-binding forkhead associated (FHA) protein
MQVTLRQVKHDQSGLEVQVTKPFFTIGRASECDLQISAPWVSRYHCQLRISQGRVTVQDVGSRNGTFVNNQQITEETPLYSGDLIFFGFQLYEVVIQNAMPVGARESGVNEACPSSAA